MSKTNEKAPEGAEPTEVTLTEFCQRLSLSDRRVELIAGFEYTEKVAGRIKGSEAGYAARYAEFVSKPV